MFCRCFGWSFKTIVVVVDDEEVILNWDFVKKESELLACYEVITVGNGVIVTVVIII